MATHTSARERQETRHATTSTKNVTGSTKKKIAGETPALPAPSCNLTGRSKTTISNALRRRAQAVIKDKSIDAESRAIIRYGLEINDPWLPDLVRRIEAGETIIETIVLLKHPKLTPSVRAGKKSKR